jgi:LemA protein
LIETVKGYAAHEREVFEKVTEARAQAISASGLKEKAKAENYLSQTLKSLFAVAENYPELKANQNFLHLQEELVDAEDKIMSARRFYNGQVRDFNISQEVFPSSIIAGLFNFKKAELFELGSEAEAAKPVVQF